MTSSNNSLAAFEAVWANVLKSQLERDYLSDLPRIDQRAPVKWEELAVLVPEHDWGFVRLADLPLSADTSVDTDLFDFQSVLAALATLSGLHEDHASSGFRLALILLGDRGRYALHLGVARRRPHSTNADASNVDTVLRQVETVARSHLPGVAATPLKEHERRELLQHLASLHRASAITGIPTLREGADRYLVQSLDRFAGQLREERFALVVLAQPLADGTIVNLQQGLMQLIAEVHPLVKRSVNRSWNESSSASQFKSWDEVKRGLASATIPSMLGTLVQAGVGLAAAAAVPLVAAAPIAGPLAALTLGGAAVAGAVNSLRKNVTTGTSEGETIEVLDRRAQYAETTLEAHFERLQSGRNLGLWETGVYLLSDSEATDQLGASLLRSLGSGAETHLEPLRVHHLAHLRRPEVPSGAIQLLQFPNLQPSFFGLQRPHPLGEHYQRLTTVLNTEELSIWMSLPRRDLPGVSARPRPPHFTTDAPRADGDFIALGHLMDRGAILAHSYPVELQHFTRHAFITGTTGSGKSVTSRHLLRELARRGVPYLVLEPAKTEYLEWALAERKPGANVRVFMPGATSWKGTPLDALHLNPFEVPDGYATQSHLDRLKATLTASFPMQEVLPILLEAALVRTYEQNGWLDDEEPVVRTFPMLSHLMEAVDAVLAEEAYAADVQRNLRTALRHRIKSLMKGAKGQLFNVATSTPLHDLLDAPAVVNLSMLSDDADKSLVMGLLLGLLYERRFTQGPSDLRHVTFVEEAHRVLRKPAPDTPSGKAFVAEMFADLLAEVRAYGEGLVIVDQVPAKLIPDALKNTNLKIVHRLQASDDQDSLAAVMGLEDEQKRAISLLRRGQAIVQTDDRAALVQIPGEASVQVPTAEKELT
ncbi:ATP-binding protein [Deinococcus yavapaiensis]|uniref:Uncharacterized protein DUF87 n=1 Tax=Deinococcus yavapaiensis KR-236 TaxID=694435 RepID=A0A318S4T5_9DEIO|nr:DUF87 domain-containing protein [Deinococcus yavapaiensis]PYE52000.1 uncharacterized protein DUF87 [Deinococcus yavapaiensis KR-236]